MLEALLVSRPADASSAALAEAVWGEDPPATWAKQLQASIGRLRKAYGAAAIVTVAGGYRILPRGAGGPLEVDVDEFEEAISRARELSAAREHPRAATVLERALALWEGRPYADLEEWPPAHDEADRLSELRAAAEDDLLEARLAAGDHRAVAEHASGLCAAEPYRERRWHALALAQYRCERQADALATVRRAQRRLVDELGIDPGASLVALEQAILRHDESLLAAPAARPPSPDCPYKGLAEYQPEDAELFFGRDDDVRAVLDTLERTGFVTVTGPSGIGKSSILRAGLVPALRRRGPEPVLLDATAGVVDVVAAAAGAPIIVDDLGAALTDADRAGALCSALASAHEEGRLVCIAVQSRHLDACAAQPAIGALVTAGIHLVAPPTAAAIRDVVERPAVHSGLTVEHGLVDVVLHDASRVESALPLLSHALAATWERRDGTTLTIEAYEATGGLAGAVARSAERVFGNLTAEQRDECHAVMRRLVTVDSTGAVTLHAADAAAVDAVPARTEAVARLVAARLLVARADDFLVAHESLTREWPRLAAWLDDDVDTHLLVAHLAASARAWDASGRHADDLYRGSRLTAALAWQDDSADALAEVEQDFLAASAERHDQEAAALAESDARDHRTRRRARFLGAVGAGAALAALVLGGMAVASHRSASRQADDALVQTLADDVATLADSSREAAALIAAELAQRWPDDPRARAALFDVAAAHPDLVQSVVTDGATGIAGASDAAGDIIVATQAGLEVHDPSTLEARTRIADARLTRGDRAVAVAPDGSVAVVLAQASGCDTGAACGRITSYDLVRGTVLASEPATVPDVSDSPLQVAIDASGAVVATVDHSRASVDLRDARSLGVVTSVRVTTPTPNRITVAAEPDGAFVIGSEGSVSVVDPTSGEVLQSWAVETSATGLGIAVTADGRALTSGPNHVALTDLATGEPAWMVTLPDPQMYACMTMVVPVAAENFYCGGAFGEVQERTLDRGGPTGRAFDVQHGSAGTLVASSTELLAFSWRSPVLTRWALDAKGPIHRVIAGPGYIVGDGYRDDGLALLLCEMHGEDEPCTYGVWSIPEDTAETIVTGEADGLSWASEDTVVAYFPSTDDIGRYDLSEQRRTLTYPIGAEVDHHFRSDAGDRQLAADPDGTVWPFDLASGEPDGPTIDVEGVAAHIVTSPDDRYVVVSSHLAGGGLGAQVFDLQTGAPLSPFVDGLEKAAVNDDGLVVAQIGSLIGRYDLELNLLASTEGSRAEIGRFQFSVDGDVFLTADLGQRSMLYDSATGRRIAGPFPSHAPLAWPAWLRQDGLEVAVDESEGIGIWTLDPDALRDAACAAAGRDLTADEWAAYLAPLGEWRSTCGFGDEPYDASS
ncbi:nSTAND1 domain-containing NTPase [Demequina mangrovi]|uniref:DNA-binding transcriptional activator of the SARP family n=1 Tax=Demequina mangrovi TaxID=1043493 RepID=A0A1H6XM58_9MICO|nr:BTAD domain-containing putative transcriptional regulator [Demequina mangrovi]SEJ25635.1 DNA-binding transcriptional activator of the SARP family [Demequina mangrovi]